MHGMLVCMYVYNARTQHYLYPSMYSCRYALSTQQNPPAGLARQGKARQSNRSLPSNHRSHSVRLPSAPCGRTLLPSAPHPPPLFTSLVTLFSFLRHLPLVRLSLVGLLLLPPDPLAVPSEIILRFGRNKDTTPPRPSRPRLPPLDKGDSHHPPPPKEKKHPRERERRRLFPVTLRDCLRYRAQPPLAWALTKLLLVGQEATAISDQVDRPPSSLGAAPLDAAGPSAILSTASLRISRPLCYQRAPASTPLICARAVPFAIVCASAIPALFPQAVALIATFLSNNPYRRPTVRFDLFFFELPCAVAPVETRPPPNPALLISGFHPFLSP